MADLKGKTIFITGASRGIGKAIGLRAAKDGANVVIAAKTTEPDPKLPGTIFSAAQEMEAAGGRALPVQVDVRDEEQIKAAVQKAVDAFGGIDILVNNAGFSRHGPIDSEDFEERWARHLDVLLTGQVRMIRAALPWLRKSECPRIVNISSTEGLGATRFISPYTAAKTGVIGLTRSLAVEFGPEGITVNCICPGPINTALTQRIPPEQKAEYARRRVALRRYAEAEEVAQMTLSLCLPAASFVTGVTLPVDGGLTIRNA